MPSHLCLSIRLLGDAFHGRGDGGSLEWPPAPLRLFQALVSASAARWRSATAFPDYAAPMLRWLESLGDPVIVAPTKTDGSPFRLSVPNNAMDVVAGAWSRGNLSNSGDANPATHRSMKTVRPTHLPDGSAVHYVWELGDADRAACEAHRETLFAAARSVVALGWGIDMAVGNGALLDGPDALNMLTGQRWRPVVESSGLRLRVPVPGTLDALLKRHEAFLNRLPQAGGFVPVPPLAEFRSVGYRCDSDRSPRPVAAFEIRKSVEALSTQAAGRSLFKAYDAPRWTPTVAGMVRHAAAAAALRAGWSQERINTFIHGHTKDGAAQARGDDATARFVYLPLPSIAFYEGKFRDVGMVRRILVVGPVDGGAEIAWLRRVLNGQELLAEKPQEAVASLSVLSDEDLQVQLYLKNKKEKNKEEGSRAWSTVTPVILPGHDDHRAAKTERLLRSALCQAGFPQQLCNEARLDWRHVGYRPGLGLAKDYQVKTHHVHLPRWHVRIEWPTALAGPVCLGAGRHYGVGLFAAED